MTVNWTGVNDDGMPTVQIDEGVKGDIRARMLELATSDVDTRKIKSAARFVESFVILGEISGSPIC